MVTDLATPRLLEREGAMAGLSGVAVQAGEFGVSGMGEGVLLV